MAPAQPAPNTSVNRRPPAVADPAGDHYYFEGCGAIAGVTCNRSESEPTPAHPMALLSWGGATPDSTGHIDHNCEAIGDASVIPACDEIEGGGLSCTFAGGEEGMSVTFTWSCGAEMEVGPQAGGGGPHQHEYTVEMTGPAVCPAEPSGGGGGDDEPDDGHGLSWGSVFLILLSVASAGYLVGGMAYNYK